MRSNHLVEGLGEVADLVAAVRQPHALAKVAVRDALRGGGHPREGAQRLGGERRADENAKQRRRADQNQQDQVEAGECGADGVVVADDLDEAEGDALADALRGGMVALVDQDHGDTLGHASPRIIGLRVFYAGRALRLEAIFELHRACDRRIEVRRECAYVVGNGRGGGALGEHDAGVVEEVDLGECRLFCQRADVGVEGLLVADGIQAGRAVAQTA